ncbi:transposase (plasmid) [Arsenophonus sp. aPb]|uniref:transposase n=1 Tax=Arsenophonus sp. aPb TaxID=3041619 RepID=UPI002469848D|nr:transposase [Arsenophonus sp. aPb]WGL99863.1 transposase [Arsenophonus sp. aPb]WGL99867.1 transposase [Arsenophonus sp. aPb]
MSKIYTAEFKGETAQLVLEQNYTHQEAAKAMNVSLSAIRQWVKTLRLERNVKSGPGLPLTGKLTCGHCVKVRSSSW